MEYESERYSATAVEESEADAGEHLMSYQTGGNVVDMGEINVIEELQQHGIGMADIQKLKLCGICTVKVHAREEDCSLLGRVDDIQEDTLQGQGHVGGQGGQDQGGCLQGSGTGKPS